MDLGRLAAVAALFLLASCAEDEPVAVHLDLTVQDWTGWSEEQPEPSSRTVEVVEGESFAVDVLTGELTITVTDVSDDEITIETSDEMAPRTQSEGYDHDDTTDTFVLERDGSVSFATATLDAGTTVTIAE